MKEFPNKAKILYLVNQFSMHGGIQRMLSHKIDAWIEEYGYEVIVVTISQKNKAIVYPPKNNFKLIDLDLEKINQHNIKSIFSFVSKIKKIVVQESPDIIITTLTGIPSLILPLIKPKIKKILEIHSTGALSVTRSWKHKWWFLKKYDGVVLLNEDEKKYYSLDNLVVIPNFISYKTDSLPNDEKRRKVIVSAGRIHQDKQYDHLVKIWEKVFSKFPNWSVEIYGDGDENLLKVYNEYISENKVDRISFNDAVKDVDEIFSNSSLFCLTSQTECFPMVLLECKKNGLPVISYDAPNGPRNIISNDGILVEHNNIEEFARQLEELIIDEEARKQMAKYAYENRHLFSSFEIIKLWRKLI